MGERSQIYVCFEADEPALIARYFQWNSGSNMISRLKHIIQFVKEAKDKMTPQGFELWCKDYGTKKELISLMEVDFDCFSISLSRDIVEEYHDFHNEGPFKNHVFLEQDNNDGQLYVYICKDGTIEYCLVTETATTRNRITARDYIKLYNEDLPKYMALLRDGNIDWIEANAKFMKQDRLDSIINADYSIYSNYSSELQTETFHFTCEWYKALNEPEYREFLEKISDDEAAAYCKEWAKQYMYVKKHYTVEDFFAKKIEETRREKK